MRRIGVGAGRNERNWGRGIMKKINDLERQKMRIRDVLPQRMRPKRTD